MHRVLVFRWVRSSSQSLFKIPQFWLAGWLVVCGGDKDEDITNVIGRQSQIITKLIFILIDVIIADWVIKKRLSDYGCRLYLPLIGVSTYEKTMRQ